MLLQAQIDSINQAVTTTPPPANGGVPITAGQVVADQVQAANNILEYQSGGKFPAGSIPPSSGPSKTGWVVMIIIALLVIWLLLITYRHYEGE